MIAALRWLKRSKETVLQYQTEEPDITKRVWHDVLTDTEAQERITITLAGDAEHTEKLAQMMGGFLDMLRAEGKACGVKVGADSLHDFKQVKKDPYTKDDDDM